MQKCRCPSSLLYSAAFHSQRRIYTSDDKCLEKLNNKYLFVSMKAVNPPCDSCHGGKSHPDVTAYYLCSSSGWLIGNSDTLWPQADLPSILGPCVPATGGWTIDLTDWASRAAWEGAELDRDSWQTGLFCRSLVSATSQQARRNLSKTNTGNEVGDEGWGQAASRLAWPPRSSEGVKETGSL